jgi:uncharacterized membrane protein
LGWHCSKYYTLRERVDGVKAVVLLVAAVALATAVEMVEALTIVLAVGVTRGGRSTMAGIGAALLMLGALVASLGPSLARIPIADLRLVIGALLLVFGVQWLRKAILRSSGFKVLHDEDEIYVKEQRRLSRPNTARDSTAIHSPSRSRASSSRALRWYSSWSPSAPPSTASASPQ